MLKQTFFYVLALLCLDFCALGQNNKAADITAQGIQIGQKLPEVSFAVENYKTKIATTSEFKGKLLILDFWATWCAPCMTMLPRMDSLQRNLADRIQFLSVTYQSHKEIEPALLRLEKEAGQKFKIPHVIEDSKLHKLFPHIYLPHYVWVNGEGKVIAITGAKEVNQENILQTIRGQGILSQKKDFKLDYDLNKPLLIAGNGGDGSALRFHSLLSGRIIGLLSRQTVFAPDTFGQRILFTNVPMNRLFISAYSEMKEIFSSNRIEYNVKDKTPFFYKGTGLSSSEWKDKFTYCYELLVPASHRKEMMRNMQSDLERYFPQYNAALKYKYKDCYVLEKTSAFKGIASDGAKRNFTANASGLNIHNTSLSILINHLNATVFQSSPYPIVDRSEIDYPVDLEINAKMNDIEALNSALSNYGLVLKLKKINIQILVISDTDGYSKNLN